MSEQQIELRKLQDEDAPRLFELIDTNRPRLEKFWWERETHSAEDSLKFIQGVNEAEVANGAPTRGIYDAGRLVGVAALHTINWESRRSMLGYWLDKDSSGRGVGTAVAHELVRLAFDNLHLQELQIATRESNAASRAIAEKLGFTLVRIAEEPLWETHEDIPIVTAVYGLSAEQVV